MKMTQRNTATNTVLPMNTMHNNLSAFGLSPGTYEAYNNVNATLLKNVYLQGNLQKINKFDVVGANVNLLRCLEEKKSVIININIVLTDGKIYKSRLYWWHDDANIQHGLICDINDKDANKYAIAKFKENANHL